MNIENIGIISAGTWGTALAQAMAHSGHNVMLHTGEKDVYASIKKEGCNKKYLPETRLHQNVSVTDNLKKLLKQCRLIILAVPTMALEDILSPIKKHIKGDHIWLIGSKGFRVEDSALPSTILENIIGHESAYGILSGPVFAHELASQKPCALTVHSQEPHVIEYLDKLVQTPYIRLYFGDDPTGAQICGALRNVIAIAAGIADGIGLGESARAAIITRGLTEIERYTVAYGGREETVRGLSGMGDVILASTSEKSRHYRFGKLIGQGMPIEEAYKVEKNFIEGTQTGRIIVSNAIGKGIDLGIISVVDGILHGDLEPKKGFDILLSRPRGYE